MKDIKLTISALNASTTSPGNYIMVLQEINCTRKLAIIIGLQEARAIAASLEQIKPVEPLNHDLLLDTLVNLKATLQHVKICGFREATFLSTIVIMDSGNHTFEVESRTSDAIALATRVNCPIYINERLLNKLTIALPVDVNPLLDKCNELENNSLEELDVILSNLLLIEDYESAGNVRDIICKKKQDQQ